MFPLAAHTFGFVWHDDAVEAFEKIAALGIARIQLMASPPHFDPWRVDADRLRRLRDVIRLENLEVLAGDLSSADVNLASPSEDVRAFAPDRALRRAGNKIRVRRVRPQQHHPTWQTPLRLEKIRPTACSCSDPVWRHDPIGTGTIDFSAVRRILVDIGFTGPVALEIQSASPLHSLRQGRDDLIAAGWTFDR